MALALAFFKSFALALNILALLTLKVLGLGLEHIGLEFEMHSLIHSKDMIEAKK